MKKIMLWTLGLLLLLNYQGYSQVTKELLQGEWIAVKFKRIDNVKSYSNTNVRYVFKGDSLFCFLNTIDDIEISTPHASRYEIEGKKLFAVML